MNIKAINFKPIATSALTLLGLLASTQTHSQTLSKEITVAKDVVPEERAASRLILTPQLVLPAIKPAQLKWAERGVTPTMRDQWIATLPPVGYASTVEPSPWRGYISAGYLPLAETSISAGYAIVAKKDTRVNASLQYDGSSINHRAYAIKGDANSVNPDYEHIKYNTQDLRLGIDASHTFGSIGTISGRVGYGLSAFNHPTYYDKGYDQTANIVDLRLAWNGSVGERFSYGAKIAYDYFGFTKGTPEPIGYATLTAPGDTMTSLPKGNKNSTFLAQANAAYTISSALSVGADVMWTTTSFSDAIAYQTKSYDPMYNTGIQKAFECIGLGRYAYSMTEVNPYLRWRNSELGLTVKGGVGLQIAAGDAGQTRWTPDARLEWAPTSWLGLRASLNDTRVDIGTLASRFARDRYINPNQVAGPSWDKWRTEAGIVVGPFYGASIEAWGGKAVRSSLFMPTIYSPMATGTIDDATKTITIEEQPAIFPGNYINIDDFDDVYYGAAINYSYRSIVTARLSWEGAPQGFAKGNAARLDRASSLVGATLELHPIKPLDVEMSYTVANGRSLYTYAFPFNTDGTQSLTPTTSQIDLGRAASFDLGATFRINDQFNVWARVENILNDRWELTTGLYNKGRTGLIGLSYRF